MGIQPWEGIGKLLKVIFLQPPIVAIIKIKSAVAVRMSPFRVEEGALKC
jgi:hypothetical protein